MSKNKKLIFIAVIFALLLLCSKCAHADEIQNPTITATEAPSPTPSPSPSPAPNYSQITDRLDDLYDIVYNTKNQIVISLWALIGMTFGYSIIKDTFK